jgi:hypothetical protein
MQIPLHNAPVYQAFSLKNHPLDSTKTHLKEAQPVHVGSRTAKTRKLHGRLFREHRRHIDLDHHVGPGKLRNIEQRRSRNGSVTAPASSILRGARYAKKLLMSGGHHT